MKYFRSYPYMLQLVLLFSMVFTLLSAGTVLISIIATKATGLSLVQILGVGPGSAPATVIVMEFVQGASNLFTFCIPALLFAYLSTPYPASYLGLRRPGRPMQVLLAMLVMIGISPVLSALEGLVGLIHFAPGVKAAQKANDDMMSAVMNIPSFGAFLRVFCIFAIVPAFGEELFFRGLLLRFSRKKSRNMVFPILFSAAVFASIHANVYGLLSIFTAGILLAVIYNLTGSLWCSIAGHMAFNGIEIFVSYLAQRNATVRSMMDSNTIPYYLVIGGLIVAGSSFYLLWKSRTPLPADWTNDFTAAELSHNTH